MEGDHVQQQEDESLHLHTHNPITNSNPETADNTLISPNFPNYPSFLSPPPHLLPPRQYPFPQQLQPSQDSIIPPSSKKPRNTPTTTTQDGCTIQDSHVRRCGRPRGSKNKPKPPLVVTREPETMSPYILELPPESDLVDSLTRFTHRLGVCICVLSATGTVKNVTLEQPTPGGGTVTTFRGSFDILSLSACVMMSDTTPLKPYGYRGCMITMAGGPQGMILGGKVVGPLFCAGTVYVVATSFSRPTYAELPLRVHDNTNQSDRVTGGDGGQSRSSVSGDGGDDSGGTTNRCLYNSSQVLFAPIPLATRPPQKQ